MEQKIEIWKISGKKNGIFGDITIFFKVKGKLDSLGFDYVNGKFQKISIDWFISESTATWKVERIL